MISPNSLKNYEEIYEIFTGKIFVREQLQEVFVKTVSDSIKALFSNLQANIKKDILIDLQEEPTLVDIFTKLKLTYQPEYIALVLIENINQKFISEIKQAGLKEGANEEEILKSLIDIHLDIEKLLKGV